MRVPVLMYHDIADSPESVPASHRPYVVTASIFREQLRLMRALGIAGVRLDGLLDPSPAAPGPSRACVLTFDDGHESNCTKALPALLEAGFGATFFVTVGWVGRPPYMTWDQIKSLAASGMEIGSHSMTHRPPSTLSRAELLSELSDSRKALEDRLGIRVATGSSPTGYFNPSIGPLARDAGYRGLCVGRIDLWRRPGDEFGIPRLPIKLQTRESEFQGLVSGDRGLIARRRAEQMIRNGLKRTLGVAAYSRLRRVWLGATGSGAGPRGGGSAGS
jgi:peptidoglycan/xylan/chitin deacetylase (PgdA/CDA1 family)